MMAALGANSWIQCFCGIRHGAVRLGRARYVAELFAVVMRGLDKLSLGARLQLILLRQKGKIVLGERITGDFVLFYL